MLLLEQKLKEAIYHEDLRKSFQTDTTLNKIHAKMNIHPVHITPFL